MFFRLLLSSLALVVATNSCRKKYACEVCAVYDQPPIAKAGSDQVITFPNNSVSLDGTGSSDPDGKISEWLWTKVSGPATFSIRTPTTAATVVNNLSAGTYQFELKVTDDSGLIGKDTIRVMVDSVLVSNHSPMANAGADQTIVLPKNTVLLDGSSCSDPDMNITSFVWMKISGPSSCTILNADAMQTQATMLAEGVYEMELKVTDAMGLFSKDTMQVLVISATNNCNINTRTLINAQLIPTGNLSQARNGIAVASAGNKIFYAGGILSGIPSSRVDIYDVSTDRWTTTELSKPRSYITTAVLGNKIFFAGGLDQTHYGSTRVDIYDVTGNTWTTTELSQGRWMMAGGAVGNKVLFAGGFNWGNVTGDAYPTIVDIYDISSNTWSVEPLANRSPDASVGIATTVIGSKIFFAGASGDWPGWDFGEYSSTINIYDASNNAWSTSTLTNQSGSMASIAVGNKNYWAGGKTVSQPPNEDQYYQHVEIRNMITGTSAFACLFQPNAGFFTSFEAALTNTRIVFFTGAGSVTNKFDIYDISTDTWSIGVLNQNIHDAKIISVNNNIYISGANVNGVLSSVVWKLDF